MVVPLQALRSALSEIVGRVRDLHEDVTVTVAGEPSATLVNPYRYESMRETLAILADPGLTQALEEAAADDESYSTEEVLASLQNRPSVQTPLAVPGPQAEQVDLGAHLEWQRASRLTRARTAAEVQAAVHEHEQLSTPGTRQLRILGPQEGNPAPADTTLTSAMRYTPGPLESAIGRASVPQQSRPWQPIVAETPDLVTTEADGVSRAYDDYQRMMAAFLTELADAPDSMLSDPALPATATALIAAALRIVNAQHGHLGMGWDTWSDVPGDLQHDAMTIVLSEAQQGTLYTGPLNLEPDPSGPSGAVPALRQPRQPTRQEDLSARAHHKRRGALAGAIQRALTSGGERRPDE